MFNVTYRREYVDVEAGSLFSQTGSNIPLANVARSGVISSLGASVTWDRRDNRLFPSKGFMLYGQYEWSPPELGATFEFTKLTSYARYYQPLPFGFVLKGNATLGLIQQINAGQGLPISELYKVGGINTVRGYFLRSISPTVLVPSSSAPDATAVPFGTGGDKQLIFNLELEFPIFEKVGIRGVLFSDAGNAYSPSEKFFQDFQNPVPLGLFWSVGFGFRWFSPIGPLRFEWGIPLNRRPTDQAVDFEFTIGNFF
jgi:outer membrane protein insertion porin family